MVTHDAQAASHADRLVVLGDGRIVRDGEALDAGGVLDLMKSLSR
jgi:ABC-type lipoprotein export system ATPase subunit